MIYIGPINMPPKIKKEKIPSKENIPSPVKATLVTPPRPGTTAFFFHNHDGAKTHGLTPNGKTLMQLQQYEGPHHRRVRDEKNPKLIISGDAPLAPPHKNQFEPEMLRLDAQLLDLKARSDRDYSVYKKTHDIDPGHFDACIRKLHENIQQIITCYKLAPNPDAFLTELNQRITDGKAYSPFGLKRLYCPKEGYKFELAQDTRVFRSPIEKDHLIPKPPAALAASVEKKLPTVSRGLYDGIEGLGDINSPIPPKRRRLSVFANISAHEVGGAAADIAKATAQEDLALAELPGFRLG